MAPIPQPFEIVPDNDGRACGPVVRHTLTTFPADSQEYSGTGRIDRSSEREQAKAEKRRRLGEALRANLKRRKAGAATASEAPEPAPEPSGQK